ncbi:3-oxoacyl-[acyl-carrier-protein] synthase III C-terminal domain-containing protein [Amycolatopsis anabasis]|uniref:3-oxoacyl-[acyl-carrier-protein] synthase III C-terminal domain-containing protein n=1 Tax=Amycolatopsis anabasis TaxID=1840409 RepID=UPI001C55289E|nr:3-oxoacyl-[acyl-carrier-protein] synthase III C-terminal domain-containing protein [Amycolatopsis anabasis]
MPVTELDPEGTKLDPATGQRSISIAAGASGPQLAIDAARQALVTSAMTGQNTLPNPRFHLHAAIWRGSRGIDFWSRASYVHRALGLPPDSGITTELNGMSNSIIGGLDVTARLLSGSPDLDSVLLTGGEVFGAPAFDHLSTQAGIAYGDGGSAAIIGRRPGLAQLLAVSSWKDPTLEGLHRGHARMIPPGSIEVGTEDVGARMTEYLHAHDAQSVITRNTVGVTRVVDHVLQETGVGLADLTWVLLPHYGHALLAGQCLTPLGLTPERTLQFAGDQWGHIGPNDQLIGLVHLLARRAVQPGDLVLLVGIGVGMTWSCALLRISHVPAEMHAHAPPLRWPWRTSDDQDAGHPNRGQANTSRQTQEVIAQPAPPQRSH